MEINYVIEILLVEDSESDALLLLEELKQHHFSPICHQVQTEQEFLDALNNRSWDAVVCDFVLPSFDAPQALKLFRERNLDIPFIVVSGVYGEERAVSMMRAGANDYILKANLSRVGPALERELESAKERKLRRRAEGGMQYCAAIVESSEDAIYGANLDSMIASWNPAAERLFGYNAEEIVGQSTVTLFPLDKRDELLDIVASVRRGETVCVPDTVRMSKSGELIPVSVTISPIRDAEKKVIGASAIVRDLRRQKLAEREQRQLNQRLSAATQELKQLSGMLPICAACKRIRDDKGYWQQVEAYISKHSEVVFSHSLCPECVAQFRQQIEMEH